MTNAHRAAIGALTLVALLALAACAGTPGPPPSALPERAATTWTLTSLRDGEGTVDRPDPSATLDLREPGRIGGSDGCASIGGELEILGTASRAPEVAPGAAEAPVAIRIRDIVRPAIACIRTNGVEDRYVRALERVRELTTVSGLTLRGDDVELRFASAPSATATPEPTPTPERATDLPAEAARVWTLPTDPSLGVDLRTPGAIGVRAGCLSYSGDLTATAIPEDPTAGAPAGPTVGITITRRPADEDTARCLGFSAGEREFSLAVSGVTMLTVVGDRLYLSGDDARLELAAAS